MKKLNYYPYPILVVLAVFLTACQGNKKEEVKEPVAIPAAGETFYYAEKVPAPGSGAFNYRFARVVRGSASSSEWVMGIEISAPYGTDGIRASFKGVLDTVAPAIRTELDYLAEGERISETRDYAFLDSSLAYVRADQSIDSALALPRVSASTYEELLKEYRRQLLAMNTTDRTRLKNVTEIRSAYSKDELETVRFVERYTELDNNYETQEYLLMLLDPMFCGSGGCTLFIIDDKGKVLSRVSVADLPIYEQLLSIQEFEAGKGKWRDLLVWSRGLRRLQADAAGVYTSNASMAEEVSMEGVDNHPERYRILMDVIQE